MEDMILQFATQKSKFFNRETDNILLYLTNKLGYGNWVEIRKAVRRENRCRYDHLFVTRSEEELKKRVIYLVQSLEKEQLEESKKGQNIDSTANLLKDKDNYFEENIDKMLQEIELETAEALSKLNINEQNI